MNTLKSVVTAVALTFALAVAAVGQTAPPPCVPGHTETPPCPAAQATSEEPAVVPGETQTLTDAQSVEIVSLVELALNALHLF